MSSLYLLKGFLSLIKRDSLTKFRLENGECGTNADTTPDCGGANTQLAGFRLETVATTRTPPRLGGGANTQLAGLTVN